MDAFSVFMKEAADKANKYGWGANTVSLLSTHEVVRLTTTQPDLEGSQRSTFSVDGVVTDRDTVIALLNGE